MCTCVQGGLPQPPCYPETLGHPRSPPLSAPAGWGVLTLAAALSTADPRIARVSLGEGRNVCRGGGLEGDGYREGTRTWEGPRNQSKECGCHSFEAATSPKAAQEADCPAQDRNGAQGAMSQPGTWRVLRPDWSLRDAADPLPLTRAFVQTCRCRGHGGDFLTPRAQESPYRGRERG